jgi:hypothetical protein
MAAKPLVKMTSAKTRRADVPAKPHWYVKNSIRINFSQVVAVVARANMLPGVDWIVQFHMPGVSSPVSVGGSASEVKEIMDAFDTYREDGGV